MKYLMGCFNDPFVVLKQTPINIAAFSSALNEFRHDGDVACFDHSITFDRRSNQNCQQFLASGQNERFFMTFCHLRCKMYHALAVCSFPNNNNRAFQRSQRTSRKKSSMKTITYWLFLFIGCSKFT